MAKKRAAERGLTPIRRRKAIRAFADTGIYVRAADACGVDEDTLANWRKKHPDFQAELDEAGCEYDRRVGMKARCALEQQLDRQLSGDRRPSRYGVTQQGDRVLVEEGDLYEVDAAKLRTALTKLDPSWTHPRQEVEHSGTLTVEQAVAEAAARLEEHDKQ